MVSYRINPLITNAMSENVKTESQKHLTNAVDLHDSVEGQLEEYTTQQGGYKKKTKRNKRKSKKKRNKRKNKSKCRCKPSCKCKRRCKGTCKCRSNTRKKKYKKRR